MPECEQALASYNDVVASLHCCLCCQEIQERTPTDPFEAELLVMAESLATAEKGSDDDSDNSDEDLPRKWLAKLNKVQKSNKIWIELTPPTHPPSKLFLLGRFSKKKFRVIPGPTHPLA